MTSPNELFVGPNGEPEKYRLVHQVGAGGEAQLWKSEINISGEWEPVALKILRADRLPDLDLWKSRWAEQAEVLRFIRHPGVVGVREHFEGGPMHYYGEPTAQLGALYLVMNWVDGSALRDWVSLHSGPDEYFESLRYLAQVGDVLDWLHSGQATPSGRPIIHADVTPSNVLVTPAGQAVLVDFGLTRLAGGASPVVEGTRGYMAPEVLASGRYSAASDRYSFGALTFFVLTGQNPPIDLAAVRSGFEQLPAVSTQPELIEHLMQMFDSDPAQRPPAGDWIRFFRVSGTTSLGSPVGLQPTAPLGAVVPPTELAAQDEPKRRRGLWTVLAVAVILALVAAGVAYAMNRHTPSEQASSQLSAAQLRRESTHSVKKKASSRPKTTGTSTSSTTSTPTVPDNSSAAPYGLSSSNTCCGSQQAATGPVNINGQQYLDSIYGTFLGAGAYNCSTGSSITYDYDLERQYSTFTATIGETDGSDLGVTAQFDVYLDSSNHAFSQVLSQGQSVPISVNVTGALTLTLTMTLTSSNCNDQGEVDAAWGNAQVAS